MVAKLVVLLVRKKKKIKFSLSNGLKRSIFASTGHPNHIRYVGEPRPLCLLISQQSNHMQRTIETKGYSSSLCQCRLRIGIRFHFCLQRVGNWHLFCSAPHEIDKLIADECLMWFSMGVDF